MSRKMSAIFKGVFLGFLLCTDLTGSTAMMMSREYLPKDGLNKDAKTVSASAHAVWRRLARSMRNA